MPLRVLNLAAKCKKTPLHFSFSRLCNRKLNLKLLGVMCKPGALRCLARESAARCDLAWLAWRALLLCHKRVLAPRREHRHRGRTHGVMGEAARGRASSCSPANAAFSCSCCCFREWQCSQGQHYG